MPESINRPAGRTFAGAPCWANDCDGTLVCKRPTHPKANVRCNKCGRVMYLTNYNRSFVQRQDSGAGLPLKNDPPKPGSTPGAATYSPNDPS